MAGALTLLLVGCAPTAPMQASRSLGSAPDRTTASAPAPLPVGREPSHLTIPALGIDQSLIGLGLQADATLQVPDDFDDIGWFTGGGRPGGIGPTVIAGHVDSFTGPAVFFELGRLRTGDAIVVTDAAGQGFDYVVTRVDEVQKSAFPTIEVFGATPTDELRLVTCGGYFDSEVGDYQGNVVVFAQRR